MQHVMRLWHTLRWLRPVQFYGRAWFKLYKPRPDLRPPPPLRAGTVERWKPCARISSMRDGNRFRFLGVERELAAPGDWNCPDWPKLWLYNAHYFDDLVANGACSRTDRHRAWIARWIAENPPAMGNGWEPYPLSLRIVNWVKWALAGNRLDETATHSLAVQIRHLRRRLEIHLLGNHLWANAKALVFAGAFFSGPEADAWRTKGMAVLAREVEEQVLADGGHFERSPMYHGIVLEDVLDLVQLAAVFPGVLADGDLAHWRDVAARMLRWLRVMSHPDGGIAMFNDAALGIAPDLSALERYARELGVAWNEAPLRPIEVLQDSGYVRMEVGAAVLIADVGKVGPDYLPGHAHADTLSFELSLQGRRMLVNGGTSTYEAGALRLQQRGTAMHNTVVVDDQDSSEVWGGFRVARRARPVDVAWRTHEDALELSAAHDGYRRLPGRVLHRRTWRLKADRLEVADSLEGRFISACASYRFAPGCKQGTEEMIAVADDGLSVRWKAQDAAASLSPGVWYPRFGEESPCLVLDVVPREGRASVTFTWT